MKTIIRNTGMLILVMTIILLGACNQDSKNEEKVNESVKALNSELQEIGLEIDKLTESNTEDFKTEALYILDKLNKAVEDFEVSVSEKGQMIDEKTKNNINQLKTTSVLLEDKLNQLEDKTEDHLIEIKHEIKYDFKEFSKSVKNFFTDNE